MENLKEKIEKLSPKQTIEFDYFWHKKEEKPYLHTQNTANQKLIEVINNISMDFFKVKDYKPDTIIISSDLVDFFETLYNFRLTDSFKKEEKNSLKNLFERIGSLKGRYSVYENSYLENNTIHILNFNDLSNDIDSEIFSYSIKVTKDKTIKKTDEDIKDILYSELNNEVINNIVKQFDGMKIDDIKKIIKKVEDKINNGLTYKN